MSSRNTLDLATHEPVGYRRGTETWDGIAEREREKERGAEEKGGDRNNVFIKKGPSKSSLIVLFAGYARAARDNSAPAR